MPEKQMGKRKRPAFADLCTSYQVRFLQRKPLENRSSLNGSHHEGENGQRKEDHEQDLGDRCSSARNAAKSKRGGGKRQNEKYKGPSKHGVLLHKLPSRVTNADTPIPFRLPSAAAQSGESNSAPSLSRAQSQPRGVTKAEEIAASSRNHGTCVALWLGR